MNQFTIVTNNSSGQLIKAPINQSSNNPSDQPIAFCGMITTQIDSAPAR
jgi:hypothetical protein